ncbi:MAG: helix-turn-helix domain-containing protein [Victivallales bacterium]|nr:helix-turn-helix domain-containing protein [Victivallales bacterium]
MKTRTGSGMDENWDEDEELVENAVASEEKKAQDQLQDEGEKSDPNTDGLDDDPIDDPEMLEEEADEDADDGEVQDPPEEQSEQQDTAPASAEKQDAKQEELPLFNEYLKPNDESSKKKAPLDLSDTHGTFGERIRKYRENAGLTADDVFERTHIVQDYLQNLETGNYASLNGKIYATRHLTTLCRCYGLSKSLQEELQKLLSSEYDKSGFGVRETSLPNAMSGGASENHGTGMVNKLPGIIIGFLLVLLTLMLVLAIVVPILSKSRTNVTQPKDMAPLVVPPQQTPPVLPVPN